MQSLGPSWLLALFQETVHISQISQDILKMTGSAPERMERYVCKTWHNHPEVFGRMVVKFGGLGEKTFSSALSLFGFILHIYLLQAAAVWMFPAKSEQPPTASPRALVCWAVALFLWGHRHSWGSGRGDRRHLTQRQEQQPAQPSPDKEHHLHSLPGTFHE